MTLPAAAAGAGGLEDASPLWMLFGVLVVVVAAAAVVGRRQPGADPLTWVPAGLERLTGIPGWAAAMVGLSWWGLLLAGVGFYNDVAWHVALGRDEELFTFPHTMIVVGLLAIALAGIVGIFAATWTDAAVGRRWWGLRVPRSAVVMLLFGVGAVSGFPLDELWHRQFGIDVTMWSPTHLLMIVGASLSPLAAWLALAEAGVRPDRSRVVLVVYGALAWITLMGLASVQGEFEFGVPQFQQLYHPVLLALAAGFAFVLTRLRLGVVATLVVGALPLLTRGFDGLGAEQLDLDVRLSGVFLGAAVAVLAVARLLGTERRLRFAVASGLAVGTVGLAVEWWWNDGAHQPWRGALLPEAFVWGTVAAIGAAVLAAAFAAATGRERLGLPPVAVALGGLAVMLAIVAPLPRTGTDAVASVHLVHVGDGEAVVEVTVTPPDAAEDARWFQTISWQGGGTVLATLELVAPGTYRSDRPVPVTGTWKTLIRLHRGAVMAAVPVYLPADPEIGEPEVPAVDRRAPFESEQRYLLREQHGGAAWVAGAIGGVVLAWASSWALAVALTARGLLDRGPLSPGSERRRPSPQARTRAPVAT
jgi:hypothetical protein